MTNSELMEQAKNLSVAHDNLQMAINCIVDIDVNQLANHLDSDISNKEAGLIKNLVNGKKITVLKSNPLNKEVKHLVNLGIFTISEANKHERL